MSRRTRHADVTVREGTGERYWYTSAGYIALSLIGIVYLLVTSDMLGSSMAMGVFGTLLLLILIGGGLVTYPAIFKDSAYLRATTRYQPKWWYYIGVGFGIPIIAYFGFKYLNTEVVGMAAGESTGAAAGLALLLFAITSLIVNAVWLYNRHRVIGVP